MDKLTKIVFSEMTVPRAKQLNADLLNLVQPICGGVVSYLLSGDIRYDVDDAARMLDWLIATEIVDPTADYYSVA